MQSSDRSSAKKDITSITGNDSAEMEDDSLFTDSRESIMLSMYNNAIRDFSEHKVTNQNAFTVKTIDQITDFMRKEAAKARHGGDGDLANIRINFQSAGIGLGVTGKVYAHRVDALYEQANMMAAIVADKKTGNSPDRNGGTSETTLVLRHVKRKAKKNFIVENLEKITLNNKKSTFTSQTIDPISRLFLQGSQDTKSRGQDNLLACEFPIDTSYGGNILLPQAPTPQAIDLKVNAGNDFSEKTALAFKDASVCRQLSKYLETRDLEHIAALIIYEADNSAASDKFVMPSLNRDEEHSNILSDNSCKEGKIDSNCFESFI